MLTDLMLAAMESSEYRALQYPDDKGGGSGWGIVVWLIVIVMALWFIIHMIGSWNKGKDDNNYPNSL
jgi:hypothetical protein